MSNKLGGRGLCSSCNQWHNNVSWHEANECVANPHSWASKEIQMEAAKTAKEETTKQTQSIGLQINCDGCGTHITKPAALVFSPPNNLNHTKKSHLCHDCYELICDVLGIDDDFSQQTKSAVHDMIAKAMKVK